MKIEDWSAEILRQLMFLGLAGFFLVSSGYDTYVLMQGSIKLQGNVTSVLKVGRGSYKTWIFFEDDSRRMVNFWLQEGENYAFTISSQDKSVISANTWNPEGNKYFGTFVGLVFLAISTRSVFGHFRKFKHVET